MRNMTYIVLFVVCAWIAIAVFSKPVRKGTKAIVQEPIEEQYSLNYNTHRQNTEIKIVEVVIDPNTGIRSLIVGDIDKVLKDNMECQCWVK